jgi:cysteine desulfuration protein SufE
VENPQGISAKALAAVLDEGLSGCSPDQVQLVSEDIVDQIFGKALSMGKGTGLRGMVRLIKGLARG